MTESHRAALSGVGTDEIFRGPKVYRANMISARDFAETYTSFWQISTPTSETLIREANRLRDRFVAPLESLTNPRAHSFVADVAFDFLKRRIPLCGKAYFP